MPHWRIFHLHSGGLCSCGRKPYRTQLKSVKSASCDLHHVTWGKPAQGEDSYGTGESLLASKSSSCKYVCTLTLKANHRTCLDVSSKRLLSSEEEFIRGTWNTFICFCVFFLSVECRYLNSTVGLIGHIDSVYELWSQVTFFPNFLQERKNFWETFYQHLFTHGLKELCHHSVSWWELEKLPVGSGFLNSNSPWSPP